MGGFLSDVKSFAGDVVNLHAHAVGGALDFVGLEDAGRAVDKWGDGIAEDLGADVGELNLGETDDPKQLIHGDVKAIGETAQHLQKFTLAFEEVAGGLSRMDSEHWQGKAADAFRKKFATQPTAWRVTADACEAAAKALTALAATLTWAQEQAQQAIDLHKKAEQATKDGQAAYNHQADEYNRAVKAYNAASEAGQSPTAPTRPAPFQDPGAAGRKQAAEVLLAARKQRVSAAGTAEQAIRAATGAAPKAPGLMDRIGNALADAPDVIAGSALHLEGGFLKGGADLLKFARGVNPFDVYNITHPALYLDHLNSVAGGLAYTANHPTELAKALVGSGWGSDPAEAGGKTLFNLLSGLATGGGSEAAAVTERVAVNALERAGQRTAVNAAERGAAQVAENAGQRAVAGLGEHPFVPRVEPAVPRVEPGGLPDGWTVKPAEGPKLDSTPVHEPAPAPAPHTPEPAAPQHPHVPEQPAPEPHHVEPQHPEPHAEPQHVEPQHAEPQHAEAPPHQPEAASSGPNYHSEDNGPLATITRNRELEDLGAAQQDIARQGRTFEDDAAREYGAKTWNETADNLPPEQRRAVENYTLDSETAPKGQSYQDINRSLRDEIPRTSQIDHQVAELDKALQAHPVPEDIVVTRGTDLRHLDVTNPEDLVGRTITEQGYMSTSLGDLPAMYRGKEAILHLSVPGGTPGLWVENVGAMGAAERELLLGRNLDWKATKVVKVGNQYHVFGEILG
ncbi:putative T7SS-secreted protein [Kitasatospora indigofera]|uniref:putative T7SS-secreted protein n=1 Tax=Kitasatospora indigofera TaxID=67307 RepID=UPI0036A99891